MKTIFVCLAATLMLLCTGCIQLNQRIEIFPDGSAEVEFHYTIPEDSLATLEATQKQIDFWQGRQRTSINWFLSEKDVREYLSTDGIRLLSYQQRRKRGRLHTTITCRVKSLAKALESGKFGDFTLTKNRKGSQTLAANLITIPDTTIDMTPVITACKDLRLTLTVETPTDIITSTAHKTTSRRATWEYTATGPNSLFKKSPTISLTF